MLKRRKISNYISSATLSKRYHYRLMFLSLAFMAVVLWYILQVIKEITEKVSFVAANDAVAAEYIYESVNHLLIVTTLSFIVYFLFSILFVLFIEQRVGGPTVAILKYIEELKKENYDYVRPLRSGDELESIMEALKDLQATLKEKK